MILRHETATYSPNPSDEQMLGGVLKFILSLSALFMFIILLSSSAIADVSPTLVNLVESNHDLSYASAIADQQGGHLSKRSLHSTRDEPLVIGSPSRHRRLRKKLPLADSKSSSNIFQSTGSRQTKKHRSPQRKVQAVIDDRLKRFRMLDPDEFQEMLSSFSEQLPYEQTKTFNTMDNIGGMQLENYWSRK